MSANGLNSIRFNMWMKERMLGELKFYAEYEGRSVSDIVRMLCNEYIVKKQIEQKQIDN